MKAEASATKSLQKETITASKDIEKAKLEKEKAEEEKKKIEEKIELDQKTKTEAEKKAEQVQKDIERIQSEMKSGEDELVGVESAAQKADREAHEAELKLKANLMEREELILERVSLRATQINWDIIGEAEFDEVDDLTKIEGLDEFSEKKLNALGIQTYEQLSRMDPGSAEVINDALEFMPQRILKMMWAQQAVRLINERR